MFESIKRARDAKLRKKESAHSQEPPVASQPEPIDASRRNFLRGAAATVVAAGVESAIPTFLKQDIAKAGALDGEAGVLQRERMLDDMTASLRRAVNAPDVRAALAGQGDHLLSRILRPIQMPIDPQFVKGTKYDATPERQRYGVQVAYPQGGSGISLIPASAKQYAPPRRGYGNGFYFGRPDKLITAQHVAEGASGARHTATVRDIAVMSVPENARARPEQVVQDDTSLNNADIHGSYVTIEGIDPDATSTNGCKSYPGVAMRLSREWADRVFVTASKEHNEKVSRSFMVVLPPGESYGEKASDKPAAGMSGSPVYMLRNGKRVLCGIFFLNIRVADPATGREMDLGFFHGIEEIREQYASEMRSGA